MGQSSTCALIYFIASLFVNLLILQIIIYLSLPSLCSDRGWPFWPQKLHFPNSLGHTLMLHKFTSHWIFHRIFDVYQYDEPNRWGIGSRFDFIFLCNRYKKFEVIKNLCTMNGGRDSSDILNQWLHTFNIIITLYYELTGKKFIILILKSYNYKIFPTYKIFNDYRLGHEIFENCII